MIHVEQRQTTNDVDEYQTRTTLLTVSDTPSFNIIAGSSLPKILNLNHTVIPPTGSTHHNIDNKVHDRREATSTVRNPNTPILVTPTRPEERPQRHREEYVPEHINGQNTATAQYTPTLIAHQPAGTYHTPTRRYGQATLRPPQCTAPPRAGPRHESLNPQTHQAPTRTHH